MITQKKPDEILTVAPLDFKPIQLGLDDALPVSMLLLLGYNYQLDPKELRSALRLALQAFPHLTGRIQFSLQPLQAALVPSDREIEIEWLFSEDAVLPELESLNEDILFAYFAPTAAAKGLTFLHALELPLLQLRLTWLSNRDHCVLGVMASHMVLDGIGLALFLNHLALGFKQGVAPIVVHDRKFTFSSMLPNIYDIPPHYLELPHLSVALAQEQDHLKSTTTTVFSISLEDLEKYTGKKSVTDARYFLAAQLCQWVVKMQPARRTLALWCNTRGLNHVPRNYTGNAGCYIHLPLEPGNTEQCIQLLKSVITRKGFSKIVETYSQLKAAEAKGRIVFWDGPRDDLISLNLVPHVRNAANFGNGIPIYAQLLSRNVSGLRIYSSSDGNKLVVEASFKNLIGESLITSCEQIGLPVKSWHRSRSQLVHT